MVLNLTPKVKFRTIKSVINDSNTRRMYVS